MRNLTLSAIATVLFLGLTSCSTNESFDTVAQETENSLLKSYKVQKDVNGRYSIDVKTSSGTDVERIENRQSNSNEIYLYSNRNTGKQNFNEKVSLDNNQLSLEFIENSQTKTSFIIQDKDIVLAEGENNNEYLQEHIFTVNREEKTVELDFKVREGVNVSFSYNEELATYEIHLKKGKSSGLSFIKTFSKDGNPIKIDFVNHFNTASRSESNVTTAVKRPRSIINI